MKKKILLAAVCLTYFAADIAAQKIEETTLKYSYTQQPKEPIKGLASYNFKVVTPYPENHDGILDFAQKEHEMRLANHPAKVEEARKIHEARVADYDHEVELAQENFRLETEAYDKLTAIEKLAQESGRPKLRMPSKPGVFVPPAKPVYREPDLSTAIIYKPGELEDTYLNLEGFEKGTDNALVGTITMEPFDAGETQRKQTTKRVYNKTTKQYENKVSYFYETPIKRPTRLVLEFNGQSIYNDIFEGTGSYTNHKSNSSPNLLQLEKDNVSDILRRINSFVNTQHGFVQVPTALTIRCPKNKGDYDDLEKAMKLAKRGVNPMGSSDGKAELAEAIDMWKALLNESNPKDKKARINANVTVSIYQNLIETALFKEEFVQAQDYLVLLGEMDLKNAAQRWVTSMTSEVSKRMN